MTTHHYQECIATHNNGDGNGFKIGAPSERVNGDPRVAKIMRLADDYMAAALQHRSCFEERQALELAITQLLVPKP